MHGRIDQMLQHRRSVMIMSLVGVVLSLSIYLGQNPSLLTVAALLAPAAILLILQQPRLGLLAIVAIALLPHWPIGTGSEVPLFPVALVVPGLSALWLLGFLLRKQLILPPSLTHLPLLLFLIGAMLSLFIGNLIWDPAVPRKDNFILVQFAQWLLFALSASAFWLAAALADRETWLKRMVVTLLAVGGCLAIMSVWPPAFSIFTQISSGAVNRAPFWLLLVAIAGGQLLFNKELHQLQRLYLLILLGAALYFALVPQRQTASYWVGMAAVAGTLVWLRFPRMRIPILVLAFLLLLTGSLSSSVWDFAGGESEWTESGASRLALIERVLEVTMRNPVTGLGPAAYRAYANVTPMVYGRAYWVAPLINSHNNYVDIFSQTGMVGLALLMWFLLELTRLGWKLHRGVKRGFLAGYVNGMCAVIAGMVVLMFLLDWILPFIYNVGFYGFQASVLIWLFLGGLVAIDNWKPE